MDAVYSLFFRVLTMSWQAAVLAEIVSDIKRIHYHLRDPLKTRYDPKYLK